MDRVLLACPLAILLIAGGCKEATVPVAAKESSVCDDVPQMALTGRVTDMADLMTDEEEMRLTERLAQYETRTKHQMVIATTPSLSGVSADDFGTCLGNRWGIGRKKEDDGIVILIAPTERQMRIATGTGMEKLLTEAKALSVIQKMKPHFKGGNYATGISAGINAIAAQTGEPL